MKVLYVTTFNKNIYDASGKELIDSFMRHNKESNLLVCYEGFIFDSTSDRINCYNIEDDTYLNKWTQNNRDVIPKMFGGIAEDDNPIYLEDKKKGQYWARYRTAGYFRKIVALNYAINNYSNEYDIICIIDADCVFKGNISHAKLDEIFDDGASMFYYWGKYRKKINRGPETGFTGYCKKNNGFNFAKIICNSYITQDFKRFEYWDDGYVIGQLINENNTMYKLKDLVDSTRVRTTRVMEIKDNPFYDIVHHFKNRHGKMFDHIELFK
jgi:hypothetical protein